MVQCDAMMIEPHVALTSYLDTFGNSCTRFICPGGTVRLYADGVVEDSGIPESAAFDASEVPVAELPDDALRYLLAADIVRPNC
jgi:hypothetical protein